MSVPVKYLSTFSGIGGFELGIQNAYRSAVRGEQADSQANQRQGLLATQREGTSATTRRTSSSTTDWSDQRPLCVGYSEVDKYAIKTYEEHFKHENYGDITTIDATRLPDFDLFVGGFPCQSFSIAGKRLGFNDTRGTLFFDIARILKEKQPKHLVLENVKGLLSHDSGKTFQVILGVLSDLGYLVEWQVLNSKNFGVPQNRERVYIVGHLRGECAKQILPITGSDKAFAQVHPTLDANYHKGYSNQRKLIQLNRPKHSNDRVYKTDGISPTLNTMQGGNRQPFIENETRVRRLTPIECERLQGFPDDWTKYYHRAAKKSEVSDGRGEDTYLNYNIRDVQSDTQRYKQCGNAVTVNVVQAVMERLYESCL